MLRADLMKDVPRHFISRPFFWPLCWQTNFMSTYCVKAPIQHSILNKCESASSHFQPKNVLLRDFEIFANFRLKLQWSEARLQTMLGLLGPYNSAQPGGLSHSQQQLCNIFCSLNQMFSYRPPIREPGVMRSARTRTSSSQMELQHKIQTLDEIPKLSTHHLASLTYQRQASPSIRSCWLQPKLHQGNICYIFHP